MAEVGNAIAAEIERAGRLSIEEAGTVLRDLSDDVNGGRGVVMRAKQDYIERAIDQGYGPGRIAELLDVSGNYVWNLRSLNGRGRRA